ncbi:MAG: hypothetical protein J6U98_01980 [Abditibacteriota bacterium]|nr:hypothetical protein [Abditibacteriota bacterium]
MAKKYFLYLVRWQLSTPILSLVLWWLSGMNVLLATIIANFIGGLIFFWVDRYIFRTISDEPLWEIKEDAECVDCGHVGSGYRIVEWFSYNRKEDKNPQYRCEKCRIKKMVEVREKMTEKPQK